MLVVVYQTAWYDIPENGNPEKKLQIKWGSEMSDGKRGRTRIKQRTIQVLTKPWKAC